MKRALKYASWLLYCVILLAVSLLAAGNDMDGGRFAARAVPVEMQPLEELAEASPCEFATQQVFEAGLQPPPGWSYACPAPAWGQGREHRGRTCYVPCFGYPALTIEVNPNLGGSLPGIIAHEICHAWEYDEYGTTSESSADDCAARWGFPNT